MKIKFTWTEDYVRIGNEAPVERPLHISRARWLEIWSFLEIEKNLEVNKFQKIMEYLKHDSDS
jgi:hypothetical protein